MADYTAPIRDHLFILEQLCGADSASLPPEWGEFTFHDAEAVLTEAGRFASEVLSPLNRVGDREGCRLTEDGVTTPPGFRDAYRAFQENGWCAASAPKEFGGQGLPHVISSQLREIWNGANMAFALCPLLTESAVTLLSGHANREQKKIWLPKLVSGEWTAAMAITEPQAGSDIGAATCRAEPDGDRYRLFGQKIFISWGDHDMTENIVHLVLARTPGAPSGSKGLSLFLSPKFLPDGARNDFRAARLEEKLGLHGSPTCEMLYGENDGAVAWLIGEEGKGLAVLFSMMNAARLAVGDQGIGIAERALQDARNYAAEREQGRSRQFPPGDGARSTIDHHPDIDRSILNAGGRITAMRLMAAEVARMRDMAEAEEDEGKRKKLETRISLLTPVVKAWCTDEAVSIASESLQIYGGAGYIEETGAAQHYRDARILPIYEGTNGIQAIDLVFRRILPDKGAVLMSLMDDLEIVNAKSAELAGGNVTTELKDALQDGLYMLEESMKFILELGHDADKEYAATPFLKQLAGAYGACLCLRAHAKARIDEQNAPAGGHVFESEIKRRTQYFLGIRAWDWKLTNGQVYYALIAGGMARKHDFPA